MCSATCVILKEFLNKVLRNVYTSHRWGRQLGIYKKYIYSITIILCNCGTHFMAVRLQILESKHGILEMNQVVSGLDALFAVLCLVT